jgi:hypothetical protein
MMIVVVTVIQSLTLIFMKMVSVAKIGYLT